MEEILPLHCTPSHLLTQSWYKNNLSVCQTGREFSRKWFWQERNGNGKKFQAGTLPSIFSWSVYCRQGWKKEGQIVTENNIKPTLTCLSCEHENLLRLSTTYYHGWEEGNSSSTTEESGCSFIEEKKKKGSVPSHIQSWRETREKNFSSKSRWNAKWKSRCLHLDDGFGLLKWHLRNGKDVQKLNYRTLFSEPNSWT